MHCHEVELGNYCHGKKMGTWEDFTRIHTLMHGNMATMISPMHLPHYEGFFGFFYFEISRWCKPQDGATVEILPAKFIYRDVLSKNSFRKFSSFFCRVVLEICDSSFLELSKIRRPYKSFFKNMVHGLSIFHFVFLPFRTPAPVLGEPNWIGRLILLNSKKELSQISRATLRYLIAVVLRLSISTFLNRHYALIR